MIHSNAVANRFIELAKTDIVEVTPLKLVKLVYLAHGWYLGICGKPLIDEMVKVGKFGPVVPSVYDEFKKFGNEFVVKPALQAILYGGELHQPPFVIDKYSIENNVVEFTWRIYKTKSPIALSTIANKRGTPWFRIYYGNAKGFIRGVSIPNNLIENYFKILVEALKR